MPLLTLAKPGVSIVTTDAKAVGVSGNSFTLDTTGGDCIIVLLNGEDPASVTDNRGNTYVHHVNRNWGDAKVNIWVALNAITGAGHEISWSAVSYEALRVVVAKGVGSVGESTHTQQWIEPYVNCAKVTPRYDGCLIITQCSPSGTTTQKPSVPFKAWPSLPKNAGSPYTNMHESAYEIQTAKKPRAVSWTGSDSSRAAGVIIFNPRRQRSLFLPLASSPDVVVGGTPYRTLLGVGV